MAQKIVNMTFKHLYCFDDAPQYYQRFNDCHMAIDRKILKWTNDKEEITCHKNMSWSTLDRNTYFTLQTEIRKYFKDKHPSCNDTILEAEFIIWYEAKNGLPFTY